MKLTGPNTYFELDILDYEYNDAKHFLDRNWLHISLKTRFQNRESITTAPLLSTWEIEMLIKWMRAIANHCKSLTKLTFVEPCLGFSAVADEKQIQTLNIKLDCEASPDWSDGAPFVLLVSACPEELELAIHDLENQLQQFPVRE
jgi:hypothetical protein